MRSTSPTVSVIVPTYNRPGPLSACLEALTRVEPPEGGLEVIVVDDGSPTPAASVAQSFEDRLDLTVIRQANAGPARARNAGAARARGTLLAFTDDDCRPTPGWACAFATAADAHPGHLLIGRTVNALSSNLYAEASQRLHEYVHGYFGPGTGRVLLVASLNMALSAEAFQETGGFDESFQLEAGEDRDFSSRWHEAGRPAWFVGDAVVDHSHRMGLRGFWRQHNGYGRAAALYRDRRTGRGAAYHGPEPLAFYLGLVGYPLRTSRWPQAWLHAGLVGLAQVANVAGYAAVRYEERAG